tara:strand:- start:164 stop:481 length:318 start_codon:yes stop_codon:yes gene_type:complete
MFNPIIERLFDYKKLISKNASIYSKIAVNFLIRFNLIVTLVSNRIKYEFAIRLQYYHLGKYLSKVDNQRYDFSGDKVLISMLETIRIKKNKLYQNKRKLKSIFND